MITKTLWERVLFHFSEATTCAIYLTVCEKNEEWELAPGELRAKNLSVVVEFNKSLTRFYLAKPWHRPCGLFGSLLFRSLVKRIRHTYLQRQLNKTK